MGFKEVLKKNFLSNLQVACWLLFASKVELNFLLKNSNLKVGS